MKGWGGHIGNQEAQGLWSEQMKSWHINNLELEAVKLTIQKFLHVLANKVVLIRSDNTTVVQYINKQGGTRSLHLCQQTWELWNLALQHGMILQAAHIAGIKNTLADRLSSPRVRF